MTKKYSVEVHSVGTIQFFKPGTEILHREDGPAVERADGYKEWYLNGKQLTQKQFNKKNELG